MDELTRLIKEDMKPALGVTEPGAIAYAVAAARTYVQGEPEMVRVHLNSAMYKNAFTCGIPNSDRVGNIFAAALGAVAADADLGLESLTGITQEDNQKAEAMVTAGKVSVELDHMGLTIDIRAEVESAEDNCEVWIRGSHTNIVQITKNGTIIFRQEVPGERKHRSGSNAGTVTATVHKYTFQQLLAYTEQVSIEELMDVKEAYVMNMELFEEGMESSKTVFVHQLFKENGKQVISEDVLKTAQLLCAGAIEARVLGLNKPAMSITGSGAHGIIATLPLFAYYRIHKKDVCEEVLLRATALSYLVTMYIKEYSGKLSAFCGCGIAAGTGMACGMAYLKGGRLKELTMVIQNIAAGITGMICDGGNQGCVMKGIVATDGAFRAVDMAMAGICVEKSHGIIGYTPEQTMQYMGRIASPGMVETEGTIVSIMKEKGSRNEWNNAQGCS